MNPLFLRFLRVCVAIALLPLFALISLFLAINLIDWDQHRGFVKATVERFTDFRLEQVEGIKIGFLTSMEAGVDKIVVRHKNDLGPLSDLETRQFYIKVKVFPLFIRKIIVQNLILDGARIKLTDKGGDGAKRPDSGRQGLSLTNLPAVFINVATINDSQITFSGQDAPWTISLDSAGIIATAREKPAMVSAEGKLRDMPFEILGALGSFDTFRDSNAAYPVRLRAKVAGQSIETQGSLNFAQGTSKFEVDISGPGIQELKRALRLNIGDIPPYTLSFGIETKPETARFSAIDLVLGDTKVSGSGGLDFSGKRMLLQADLQSEVLHARDVKGLFKSSGERGLRDPKEPEKPKGQYFTDKTIRADFLNRMDADIQVDVNRFEGERAGAAIDGVFGRIRLNSGLLVMNPLRFAVAEGTIGGELSLDAREKDIKAKITLSARRVNLSSLLGRSAKEILVLGLKPSDVARGKLSGFLDIAMHGRTPMQLAQTVTGPVQLAVEDGRLSATLIEIAGIDISETLGDIILGHPLKELRCGLISLDAREGVFRTESFIIATSDSNMLGSGQLNLPRNKVDFTLDVLPKDFSIGSLRSPIKVSGELNKARVSLDANPMIAKGVLALALGMVNPALAVLPFVEPGLSKAGGCSKYKSELKQVLANAERHSSREYAKGTQSVLR